jgi:hypothetical protein
MQPDYERVSPDAAEYVIVRRPTPELRQSMAETDREYRLGNWVMAWFILAVAAGQTAVSIWYVAVTGPQEILTSVAATLPLWCLVVVSFVGTPGVRSKLHGHGGPRCVEAARADNLTVTAMVNAYERRELGRPLPLGLTWIEMQMTYMEAHLKHLREMRDQAIGPEPEEEDKDAEPTLPVD